MLWRWRTVDKTIKRLRKKYILTASAIACSVVVLMLFLMNLLMYAANRSEMGAVLDMVTQTAFAESEDFGSETIFLSDMKQNADGDYIIPRKVQDIESVTLCGRISCNTKSAEWYSAGGGLMFEVAENGTKRFAYREYQFNKDTSEVTIDFSDDTNLKYETNIDAYRNSGVNEENFLVSIVWWKNISDGTPEDVSLVIDSIDIQYKADTLHISETLHSSYAERFTGGIPAILNDTNSFYLITDMQQRLLSVSSGSLLHPLTEETAGMYAEMVLDETSGTVTLHDGTKYRFQVTSNDSLNVIAFVSSEDGTAQKLLAISILSGMIILIVLFVIIYIVSGSVVKPVAEAFDKQKQFISNASHELKTPVTVISATADMLERKSGKNQWIDQIRTQSERMGNLVNELLELSRLSETEQCQLNFERIDLSETVSNTILYFESRAYEENHPIESDIAENIHINGDALKLERLVGILLDNALKYADAGGVITVSLTQEKDRIILTCTNPCRNFDASDTSCLFERFYRCEESHSSEKDGYGLGLSIAKAITELHGGEISVCLREALVEFRIVLKK